MAEPSTDQPQTTSAEPTELRRGRGTWSLWLIVLPVLYVLSIGPMTKLTLTLGVSNTQPALEHCLEVFYAPVIWCATHSSYFNRFLRWYWRDVWHVTN
jgi:hypothetical protein